MSIDPASVRLAGNLLSMARRARGTDAGAALDELGARERAVRALLQQPVGTQLLAERIAERLKPWMHAEVPYPDLQLQGLAALNDVLERRDLHELAIDVLADPNRTEAELLRAHALEVQQLDEGARAVFRAAIHVGLVELAQLFVTLESAPKKMLVRLVRAASDTSTQIDDLARRFDALETAVLARVPDPKPAPTKHPDSLMRLLSEPRLTRYRELASSDEDALRLYRWNIEMSAELYRGLHLVEVVLRNALDAELARWNPTADGGGLDWIDQPARPLIQSIGRDIERAKDRAILEWSRKGRPGAPGHDDVLAQCSFGTWRFLLPRQGHRAGRSRWLWRQAVSNAFPHLPDGDPGFDLESAVAALHQVRNRVAHLEPVLSGEDNRRTRRDIIYVFRAIDPLAATWYDSQQLITRLLREKPLPED